MTIWVCPACQEEYAEKRESGKCGGQCNHDFEAQPTRAKSTVAERAVEEPKELVSETECAHCGLLGKSLSCEECCRDRRGTRLRLPWGEHWLSRGDVLTICRMDGVAGYPIDNQKMVSREHADIRWSEDNESCGEGVEIHDWNSTNGTLVDDVKIESMRWVFVPKGSRIDLSPDAELGLRIEVGDV